MTKQIVAPEKFLELVNQAIKEHSAYSKERPIVMTEFNGHDFIFLFSNAPNPPNEMDRRIAEEAAATVQANYTYKNESGSGEA